MVTTIISEAKSSTSVRNVTPIVFRAPGKVVDCPILAVAKRLTVQSDADALKFWLDVPGWIVSQLMRSFPPGQKKFLGQGAHGPAFGP